MANRAYLYSLDKLPTRYDDRPEHIQGLSEWAYDVPFSYRVLMSGSPQLCASLLSNGFVDEDPAHKSPLHAIGSPFAPGFSRLEKLLNIVRYIHTAAPVSGGFLQALSRKLFGKPPAAPPTLDHGTQLLQAIDETLSFLTRHRQPFLLLETLELDILISDDPVELRHSVEDEIFRCEQAGAAIDALPGQAKAAAPLLLQATRTAMPGPLAIFHGLQLDDDCDKPHDDFTPYPLGLEWHEDLYFDLFNRRQFEEHLKSQNP